MRLRLQYDVRVTRIEIVNASYCDDGSPNVAAIGEALERAARTMSTYGGELVPESVRVLVEFDQ